MTIHREAYVPLKDLSRVVIACAHCKTKITFDLAEQSEHQAKYGVITPNSCPGCQKSYDTSLEPGLKQLLKAHGTLRGIGEYIEFILDEPKG